MARFDLIGSSYSSQSPNADSEMTMNWYQENMESSGAKSAAVLYPTPGLATFCTVTDHGINLAGPVKAIYSTTQLTTNNPERLFAVVGDQFIEIFSDGTYNFIFGVSNGGVALPAIIVGSSIELLIGLYSGPVYSYNLATGVLLLASISNSKMIGYSDGYFISLKNNSNEFQISGLNDANSWDPLDVAAVSQYPDIVQSMIIDHREIWLFGAKATIPYYNSGNADFPFEPVQGAFIEQGLYSQATLTVLGGRQQAVKLDNTVFWIGGDERGNGIAWRAQGYLPVRVSNHAVEYAWSQYSTIADYISYSFQYQGHTFWHIYFPTADKSWRYDVATGQWAEVGFWDSTNGVFTAHRSQCHAFCFGKHLVGDWNSPVVYDMNLSYLDDFGNPIRRVRRSGYISLENHRMRHNSVEIDLETGLGPIPPLTAGPSFGAGPSSFCLKSPNGTFWTCTIGDAGGSITTVAAGAGPADAVLITDSTSGTKTYQLVIGNTGVITASQVVFELSAATSFPMLTSTSGYSTGITVSSSAVISVIDPATGVRAPQLILQWCDDGRTLSPEQFLDCGQAGEYSARAIAWLLGESRRRYYQISVTDPIPWRIIEGYVDADPAYGVTERLSSQLRKGA